MGWIQNRSCVKEIIIAFGLAAAGCSSSGTTEIAFHGEQQALPSFNFDSGLQPPASPVQLQAILSAAGEASLASTMPVSAPARSTMSRP